MIEKWLREELESKLTNNHRVVITDVSSCWEFLVDALCVNIPLVKSFANESSWEHREEELFLRCKADKEYKNTDVVFYVSGGLEQNSFLIEYARTGGCVELSTESIRDTIFKKTGMQVSLSDAELKSACHVGIGKDVNWWKRIIQKIDSILLLEEDILYFLDSPNQFMQNQSPEVRKMYIQEFCNLLDQPLQEKPFDTFANEIAKHIFDGIVYGSINGKEYTIYTKWIDSREHEKSLKKHLSDYKIPSDIKLSQVNDNHCFSAVDRMLLSELVINLNNQKKVESILSKAKKRISNMNKNPYVAKWWPDITYILSYKNEQKYGSLDDIAVDYTSHHFNLDRSMRRILSYLLSSEDLIRPIQEYYDGLNNEFLSNWFANCDSYLENQSGYLVKLIKDITRKTAIIVGDGLRYEVAESVASKIESNINISKSFMFAGLPSETEHNMSLLYTSEGKTIAEKSEREKKLSFETGKDITYLQLDQVNETTEGDILVLTYKDIDDAGEKMQQSMLRLVNEFEDLLVEKIQLLLHIGYQEVYLVTDHGFVLTGILDEADKISTDDISGKKKVSERFVRTTESQNTYKYISVPCEYGEYHYVCFSKSCRPFSSTGKYGYSHGGLSPQEVIIPNFKFTCSRNNKLDVKISNKKDLTDVTGNVVTIKLSSGEELLDIMSIQRRVRVIVYSNEKEIDKSSILTIGVNNQTKVDLSLNNVETATVVVIDEDTKDQLDKAKVNKTQMRDLGGLL